MNSYYMQSYITHSGQQFYGSHLFDFKNIMCSSLAESNQLVDDSLMEDRMELEVDVKLELSAVQDIQLTDYSKPLLVNIDHCHQTLQLNDYCACADVEMVTSEDVLNPKGVLNGSLTEPLLMPIFYQNLKRDDQLAFLKFWSMRLDVKFN